ncbi:Hypothetical predicted protein [Cloeon dipterum]|uniref:Uncharacterized protein n=1 Tax=Cloeon dipterum TaxID=197152 RepID=A0A8S1DI86_9INSE|nr:Hypothetical predicted protein [Cloeon dipterum]
MMEMKREAEYLRAKQNELLKGAQEGQHQHRKQHPVKRVVVYLVEVFGGSIAAGGQEGKELEDVKAAHLDGSSQETDSLLRMRRWRAARLVAYVRLIAAADRGAQAPTSSYARAVDPDAPPLSGPNPGRAQDRQTPRLSCRPSFRPSSVEPAACRTRPLHRTCSLMTSWSTAGDALRPER